MRGRRFITPGIVDARESEYDEKIAGIEARESNETACGRFLGKVCFFFLPMLFVTERHCIAPFRRFFREEEATTF